MITKKLIHCIDEDARVSVYASDTDIFLQLINAYEKLPKNTVFVSRTSTVAVRESYKYLGKERENAIIGFHAFTDMDMTGKFAWRSKEKCVKHFLSADFDILSALAKLGKSDRLPDETMISNLEICTLYGSKKYAKLQHLRWFLYSHKQAGGESLPSTLSSLKQHINRAHYMAMIVSCNRINFQLLPSPILYGWEIKWDAYAPVTTINATVNKAVQEIVAAIITTLIAPRCVVVRNMNAITPNPWS